MLFLLLSGAIFGACSPDKDRVPVFVKNVVMPPDSWVFAPGDGVTVSAEGFEADDEIMLEIHWQESAEGFAPEGYAKGVRGIVTVRSATSVTFLAPGHYPASTVRVLLLRRGRMMPLGKIRVANGTPKAEALYGISKSDTDETLIERIDLSTGGVTRVATLGIGRGIACAVGLPGSGWIYGVCSGSMAGFDLTMNYYDDFGCRNYLFAGQVTDSSVGLISHDAGRLTLTLVAAGVVAKKMIGPIEIRARITELGGIPRERLNCEPGRELGAEGAPTLWDELIDRTLRELDSVGGVIECTCDKVPVGLGEPFFDSLESQLAHLAFSIPAVRGIEFGDGFAAARMKGSEHNDCFVNGEGKTATNGAGGINGGISNGNPVVFRVAVKPTSSIAKKQYTFNFATGRMEEFVVKGRHDACIALRCPVVVEAIAAIALANN